VAGPHRGIEDRAVERALGSVRPVAIGVGESVVTVGIDGGELRRISSRSGPTVSSTTCSTTCFGV